MTPTSASLSIFRHLFASAAEEMGVTLERAAYSPNIKERLDFSCAVFMGDGRLLAQAAHIPVHLGAMPASVQAAIAHCNPFQPGDVVILNDPYQGGNHLPDITLVSPVFITPSPDSATPHYSNLPIPTPAFFVASRAHHADVGGMSPGSMPLSTELYQEGIVIPPIKLVAGGERNEAVWQLILRNVRTPAERNGDLAAQLAAHAIGTKRLTEIVGRYGLEESLAHATALIEYAARLTQTAVSRIPNGRYTFTDYLDNDGQSADPLPIQVTLSVTDDRLTADFSGTAAAVTGNLNAVPAITHSAVAYCLRCAALAILQVDLPMNQGAFDPITTIIEPGSLLDPHPPHAVAAGNVETSQRIVDVIFGAMAQALPDLIPAAGQGTMNNLTFGGTIKNGETVVPTQFAYYETIGGGCGAGPTANGGSGMHVHMSNTLNTPIEALEYNFPLRVQTYSLRQGSGGEGKMCGGDGLHRAIEFLTPVQVTVTSERRDLSPYGLHGGLPGKPGQNSIVRQGEERLLPGKFSIQLQAGDTLHIVTPGGGGWGKPPSAQINK
ncbi:MAG: hydantoinase B/oxoprolinase family protein [Anaerolineales bacterium]|nr:hydantoinase B/oxoprolinase family protein [Anaerolineales bacterium]